MRVIIPRNRGHVISALDVVRPDRYRRGQQQTRFLPLLRLRLEGLAQLCGRTTRRSEFKLLRDGCVLEERKRRMFRSAMKRTTIALIGINEASPTFPLSRRCDSSHSVRAAPHFLPFSSRT